MPETVTINKGRDFIVLWKKLLYKGLFKVILVDFSHKEYLKINLGHDNLSMFKNLLKYRHENKKQVCNSFTYFRG